MVKNKKLGYMIVAGINLVAGILFIVCGKYMSALLFFIVAVFFSSFCEVKEWKCQRILCRRSGAVRICELKRVSGGYLIVLSWILIMVEASRTFEWKAIILFAGMLRDPLQEFHGEGIAAHRMSYG